MASFLGMIGLICWSIYIFTSSQALIVYIGTIIDLALEFLIVGLIIAFFYFKKSKQKKTRCYKKG